MAIVTSTACGSLITAGESQAATSPVAAPESSRGVRGPPVRGHAACLWRTLDELFESTRISCVFDLEDGLAVPSEGHAGDKPRSVIGRRADSCRSNPIDRSRSPSRRPIVVNLHSGSKPRLRIRVEPEPASSNRPALRPDPLAFDCSRFGFSPQPIVRNLPRDRCPGPSRAPIRVLRAPYASF